MKYFKSIFLFISISFFFYSCSKNNVSPVSNNNSDSALVQYGTPYANVPAANDVVMYEVNIPDLSSAGNFAGVVARLDSIKALGVNVIWLMPVYPRGVLNSINSPYCVQNYEAVNSNYGSLADLQNLVSTAHSKGMSVILDWVADHTSWDNVWIGNKSWYQQDASGNIISPPGTNWTDVAALNYNNADMYAAMIKAMKYWMYTANIDGYRCDAAGRIPQAFWTAAIDTIKAIPGHKLVLLAEDNTSTDFAEGFQMCYGWNYYGALLNVFGSGAASASTLTSTNTSENYLTNSGSYILRFTTNHDYDDASTPLDNFDGKQGSLAAFVLSSYMGGVPLIYDGQEVGCETLLSIFSQTLINWTTNPDMLQQYELLMSFRNTSNAVKGGAVTYFNNDNNISAFERTSGNDSVLVLVNVLDSISNYALDPSVANTSWLDALNNKAAITLGTQVTLQPYQYMILSNQ